MTVREVTGRGRQILGNAKVPGAAHDASALLASLIGMNRLDMALKGDMPVSAETIAAYEGFIARRAQGEPLQYILGEAPFYGYMFRVRPGVLIPRFDTESVCERALAMVPGAGSVLDLCCGSGILGIVIALKKPGVRVTLTDISEDALTCAGENAVRLRAGVRFRQGDLFDAVPGETFDMIVSNPPYIPDEDMARLDADVRREPPLALRGGADGMDFYRRILQGLPGALRRGGGLCMECSEEEAMVLLNMLKPLFSGTGLITDVSGHLRGAWGEDYIH